MNHLKQNLRQSIKLMHSSMIQNSSLEPINLNSPPRKVDIYVQVPSPTAICSPLSHQICRDSIECGNGLIKLHKSMTAFFSKNSVISQWPKPKWLAWLLGKFAGKEGLDSGHFESYLNKPIHSNVAIIETTSLYHIQRVHIRFPSSCRPKKKLFADQNRMYQTAAPNCAKCLETSVLPKYILQRLQFGHVLKL